ncbi:hypothetical protein EF096_17410 [Pseudomonas neustonica]|uniref:Lipoprotein n=1 Tax=Pseudomonas neustonica TaxID=2487346 RepID=A0ABX9XDY6_9PSED|nr:MULTISPECIES: hypothetical protein [Pseudomonas]ROZ81571.1 hypothetical protein EF096_17410 [Pseudomonas neustonica]ROZ84218.1 hypothetical protein EF099_07855 [Pseudomonas sp. SSM44]
MKSLAVVSLLACSLVGCDAAPENTTQITQPLGQCTKDTDCKGNRICETGQCTNPSPEPQRLEPLGNPVQIVDLAPAAPSISYEALLTTSDSGGPFSIEHMDMGTALTYQSRAGVMNLMEYVVDDPESTGYVSIEKVYSFGPNNYVLVVSTGEMGRSCEANTYAFSFDSKQEYVDGKTNIDGCSETVETFAEGNKLSIRKDGETTIVYNGVVK